MNDQQIADYSRLHRSLTNITPNEDQIKRIENIRGWGQRLGNAIIMEIPPSRERSIALTELETTVMWAIKAIVMEPRPDMRGIVAEIKPDNGVIGVKST